MFLLLQVWYLFAKIEKHDTSLDLFLLKIWLKKVNFKIITQSSSSPIGVLLVAQVECKSKKSDKFKLAVFGMLWFLFLIYMQ